MSSLARRSLRTTAAAGIAALGVGIAGPAFATTGPPAVPNLDALKALNGLTVLNGTSSTPDASTVQKLLAGDLASVPGFGVLPALFHFETPTVSSPAPATATAPAPKAHTTAIRTANIPPLPDVKGVPLGNALAAAALLKPLINTDGTKVTTAAPAGNHIDTGLPDPTTLVGQNNIGGVQTLNAATVAGLLMSQVQHPGQLQGASIGN